MNSVINILILDDSKQDQDLVLRELTREGFIFEATWAQNRRDFEARLTSSQPDLILADYDVPGFDGLDALELARLSHLRVPFIYVSGTIGEEIAIESLHKGATDYVLKNNLRRLGPSIRRALAEQKEREARKWATDRLLETENIYESLVGNIPQNIFREDADGCITYANQPFCDLFDKRIEEVIGGSLEDLLPTRTNLIMKRESEFARRNNKTTRQSEEFQRPNGETMHIEIVRVPLRDSEGRDIGLQVMFWDVTEQREYHQAVEKQAKLLDLAPVAIIVVDGRGTVSYWNEYADIMHGVDSAGARGKPLSELIQFGHGVFDTALEAACSEGLYNFEFELEDDRGRPKTLLSRWTVVADEIEGDNQIIVMNTDITETKKLEQQFFHAQRLEGIGTLACGVAHDLNNILGPIMMSAEMIAEQTDDPTILECIETSQTCANRGAAIVKQLLTIGRGVAGEKIAMEARIVLAEVTKMAQETFPKNITIRNLMPKGLWTVVGDPTQIHQVFLNLLVNARDAMPDGGRITINGQNFDVDPNFARFHAHANVGPHLLITVEDTGTGIPPELKDRIFDPFFTTKEEGKGTGLGLATTMGIVKGHGGFVVVYSEPDKGTAFNIYLPAETEEKPVDESEHTVMLERAQGQRVLVAEDEASVANLLCTFLKIQGYAPSLGANGVEALALFERNPNDFHLVITDVDMPEMNGFKFAKRVREVRRDLPIVVTTGLGTAEQIDPFETELDIHHFLPKPFDSRTLLKTVSAARQDARNGTLAGVNGF